MSARIVTGVSAIVSTLAALALLALVVASEPASGGTRACTPGVRQVNGGLARVFCGPARATVAVAGKRLTHTNGECVRTGAYFTINVGTTALDANVKPKPSYFGITVGRTPLTPSARKAGKDGVYGDGLITFVRSGKVLTLRAGARLVLKNDRRAGSFSGRTDTGKPASGTFACGGR